MVDLQATFARRLVELRGSASQRDFARSLGIHHNTLAAYERGEGSPDLRFLTKISDISGRPPGWVLGLPTQSQRIAAAPDGFVELPLLDVRAAAGAGALAQGFREEEYPFRAEIIAFREDWLRQLGISARFARILICDGDSMNPTIAHGDMMLVDTAIRDVRQDGIYVLVYSGLLKVKRVQMRRDGILLLKSDNPAYETEEVPMHEQPELIIEGRVRWVGGAI